MPEANPAASPPPLKPLIISAPFGNYVQPSGATATLGTFTLHRRPGRVWRVLRTVRYYRRLDAWVNRIGLRNPGIDWLVRRVEAGRIDVRDKVVSVHGFDREEWAALLERVERLRPLAVELNLSCPNVGERVHDDDVFDRALGTGVAVIAKLPPVRYEALAEGAVSAGVRAFHCCNTLPVPGGGMSGAPLKPLSLACVSAMRARYAGAGLLLIGGGGIREPADLEAYAQAGADRFAVGTLTMNPLRLWSQGPLRPLIDRAAELTGGPET